VGKENPQGINLHLENGGRPVLPGVREGEKFVRGTKGERRGEKKRRERGEV